MASSPVLPAQFSLKYDKKFLCCQTEFNRVNGLLKFDDGEPKWEDSNAVFEVEGAKTWDGLVHIKCLYNNKYLVRWNPDDGYIGASANAPDEDKGSWTCTLFRPALVGPSVPNEEGKSEIMKIRLYHIHTEHTTDKSSLVGIVKDDFEPYINCLTIEFGHKDYEFTVIDHTWPPVPKWLLPKFVAFKLPSTNIYLIGSDYKGKKYLAFSFWDGKRLDEEIFAKVAHQIFPNPEGVAYIKSFYHSGFWKSDGYLIRAEVDDLPRHADDKTAAMFRVVMHNPNQNVVGFLNMNSTNCCRLIWHDDIAFLGDQSTDDPDRDSFISLEVVDLEKLVEDFSRTNAISSNIVDLIPREGDVLLMSNVNVADLRKHLLMNITPPGKLNPLTKSDFNNLATDTTDNDAKGSTANAENPGKVATEINNNDKGNTANAEDPGKVATDTNNNDKGSTGNATNPAAAIDTNNK